MISTTKYIILDDFGSITFMSGRFRVGDLRNKKRFLFKAQRSKI